MPARSARARTESRPHRRTRGERGTSAVEFAIVTPIFLFLIFGIIEAGLYYHARNSTQSAAREGVAVLRTAGTTTQPGAWTGYAEKVAGDIAHEIGDLDNVRATATIDTSSGRVTVTVTGDITLPLGGTFSVSQSSAATLEQFRPDRGGAES